MKEKSKKSIDRHKRKYFDLRFPHIRTALVISTLAIIALVASWMLDCQGIPFWSSIFANIFAGFVTGLIICIISGKKQRKIATGSIKEGVRAKSSGQAGVCSEDRSMISPDYARNFICDFILGEDQLGSQLSLF